MTEKEAKPTNDLKVLSKTKVRCQDETIFPATAFPDLRLSVTTMNLMTLEMIEWCRLKLVMCSGAADKLRGEEVRAASGDVLQTFF